MADVKRLELLAGASIDTLIGRTSDPGGTLRALEAKLEAALTEAEGALLALPDRLEALEARLETERTTAAKCDAIITKARADGRADLEQAATERKDRSVAAVAQIERELAEVQVDAGRLEALSPELEGKLEEVRARLSQLPASPATPELGPGPGAHRAAAPGGDVSGLSTARVTPEAAPAAEGDDAAWEGELAALMKSMGMSATPTPTGAGRDEDEDPLAGIPDLVVVPDDALPEGEELPPAPTKAPAHQRAVVVGPVDLPATKGAAGAPLAKPAAAPPARSDARAPATRSEAKPPAEDKKSGATLWIVVVLVALAAVAAWFFLGRT